MWTAALSPPRLSRLSGGGPFLLLCAVEAWRCVALLALILAAVQAGSVDSDAPSEGDAVRWNHSVSGGGKACLLSDVDVMLSCLSSSFSARLFNTIQYSYLYIDTVMRVA